jgi:hypothetical protein
MGDVEDEDEVDNSFADNASELEDESSSEDPEEEEDDEEYNEEEDSPDSPVKKKERILDVNKLEMEGEKPRKIRRTMLNAYCTEYDIIHKVAKKILNYRLREHEEDHEGAVVNGQGNQRLREDWDISWHDLGITADFLTKMQPYQKVNQYPGMYQITRKNYLARNLMKMQRAFPDDYKFFPKTWLMPQEAQLFRN